MCQVSPWQLIRDRMAAKTRAVHFVFVKVHQRWLKLRSAGAVRQRVAIDDEDARAVRGNALLVAAGWRAGLHVQVSVQGLRDQLKGVGKATATEVQLEVQARPNPSGIAGGRGSVGTGGSDGNDPNRCSGGDDSSRGSGGGDSNSGKSGRLSNRSGRLLSRAVRGEVTDPVTRRLLTACNTDWRLQPNAVDVCKAPTAAQVPQSSQATTPYALSHSTLALPTSRTISP